MFEVGHGTRNAQHNLSQQSADTMALANELNPQQPLTENACQS